MALSAVLGARYAWPGAPSPRPRTSRNNVAKSSAGARVRLGITSPCPMPEEMIATDHGHAEQGGGRHDRAASRQQDSPNRLEHSGGDLERGRPRKAKAAKRVQLPMVKDELH